MNYSSALFANCDSWSGRKKPSSTGRGIARAEGGDRVLEIGCGWGGFAERGIRHYGATSPASRCRRSNMLMAKRGARRGRGDLVDFRLVDYRDVEGSFDRIASIEMFEAVGERIGRPFRRSSRRP